MEDGYYTKREGDNPAEQSGNNDTNRDRDSTLLLLLPMLMLMVMVMVMMVTAATAENNNDVMRIVECGETRRRGVREAYIAGVWGCGRPERGERVRRGRGRRAEEPGSLLYQPQFGCCFFLLHGWPHTAAFCGLQQRVWWHQAEAAATTRRTDASAIYYESWAVGTRCDCNVEKVNLKASGYVV